MFHDTIATKNIIYHDIQKDAEHNTHAKIILEEIHNSLININQLSSATA